MQPIVQCVKAQATTRPHQIAVITGSTETSYADLWTQITRAAAWYRGCGIQAGERVLISADSRDPYCLAAYFGAHLVGAIAVPIAFRTPAEEIEQRSQLVGSKFAVFGEWLAELRQLLAGSASASHSGQDFEAPELSDIAEIMFTTGSSGLPKGVTLSHGNIAASAELIRRFVGNTEEDREVVTVPLTHSFGLGRVRSMILAGGTVVLVPGLAFPQLVISALKDHSATGLACVPAGVSLLMSKYEEALAGLAGQLRYLEMGSMHFPLSNKIRLLDILPDTRLCMHYGLTEASRSTFLEFHSDRDHLESVGKPSPGVEVSIMDETKLPVHIGDVGLIHVRAATVMQGYWNDSGRTEQVLDRDSGWLNTNDLGFKDADGYFHLLGRADEVINTGGVKVLPDNVEAIASEFGGFGDCGCVGVPDPDGILGEIPMLFVTSDNSALDLTELSRFIRDRLGHEVPTIAIKLISNLPRSASGKLLRRELRSKFDDEQAKSE